MGSRAAASETARSVAMVLVAVIATLGPLASRPAGAAGFDAGSFEYDALFRPSQLGQITTSTSGSPEVSPALERPIDPATYTMVPGDVVQIEVGGETDRGWRVAVSAEGDLLLPGVDSVPASGRSLAEVDGAIREKLSVRFPGKPLAVHLLQPGAFRVPVTGLVVNPGIQSLRGYDRLSIALAAAGGPLPGGTLRRVVLEQPDGSKREVDLVRFAIEGDVDQNPPLRPGCRVHVPPAQDFVRVAGAVRGLPGPTQAVVVPNVGSRIVEPPNIMLEWLDGDTAGFLLARAGGLSEDASGEVFLVRGGERRALSREEAQSLPLEAGDQLEAAVRNRWVYVIGAVRYPGPYAHLPTRTASDYVRMAGGPTELGRGDGWKLRPAEGAKAQDVGSEAYLAPGATVIVPERWTYRVSTLLAPISGITALVISVVALTK